MLNAHMTKRYDMKNPRFIAYYRVSTSKQGIKGLGMDAQKDTVTGYLERSGGVLLDEFKEVESGRSGDRPELLKAVNQCKLKNATLLVAKLDRLSRDLHFITSLQKSEVPFLIAENPQYTDLTIHILAAVAQDERRAISQRTKAALAAAKARGVKLGNPRLSEAGGGDTTNARKARTVKADSYANAILPVIEDIRCEIGDGASLRSIAKILNERGFTTSRGCGWTAAGVSRVQQRLAGGSV